MDLAQSATTITEFVEWATAAADLSIVEELFEAAWFRGTNSAKYKLIPSLYRSKEGLSELSDAVLRDEFKRRALPLVAERPPRDDWEWYFLMQHYNAPTRLLDWTDSALVALYFAISSVHRSDEDLSNLKPAVWVLNPWALNRRFTSGGPVTPGVSSHDELMSKYLKQLYTRPDGNDLAQDLKYPVSIDPSFIAQRMLVQHSHFTLHGHDARGLDEMMHDTDLNLGNTLHKVTISTNAEGIRRMRWDLAILGITETTIYPDLTGLGRELNLEYGIIS
jgi:hypothetical protein